MANPVMIATANAPVLSIDEAWDWVEETGRQVRQAGGSVLVLAELMFPGYNAVGDDPTADDIRAFHQLAERLDGPAAMRIMRLCQRLELDIVYGLLEKNDDGAPYNAMIWASARGHAAVYRKTHLFANEGLFMQAGDQLVAVDTPWGRSGLLICRDKEFPEVARQLRLAGARLLIIPSAWTAGTTHTFEGDALVISSYDVVRAIENNCWVVSANYSGVLNGLQYLGQSSIVNPSGYVVAGLGREAGWTMASVDLDCPVPAYASVDMATDRRTELYDPARVQVLDVAGR